MKKHKMLSTILLIFVILFIILIIPFFIYLGFPPEKSDILWGVNFSQKHTQNLDLNWKDVYLSLLKDLKTKNIKIGVHWDLIEPEKGKYNFDDLDWQIREAEKENAKIILVIGYKVPRWPECHFPHWVNFNNNDLGFDTSDFLSYLEKVVNRYKNSSAIWAWQLENEPFFPFGNCPKFDEELFKKEINLVKYFDPDRPIIVSESGEFSLWFKAARYGDIVGVTMYKKAWFKEIKKYFSYPFSPFFYWFKQQLVKKIFNKDVICIELQAEPWGSVLLYDLPITEQEKTMDLKQFQKNIKFAKRTGFDTIYLWGAEWWYWLKERHNKPEMWEEAKKLF